MFRPRVLSGAEFSEEEIARLSEILAQHDYTMQEALGNGSFSCVFTVRSRRHNRNFAAKIMDVSRPQARQSALQEQVAIVSVMHPNIIRLYDHFAEDNFQFLILEHASACSLKTLIFQAGEEEIPNLWALFAQICDAVAHLHARGFAHRDIKPANILLDYGGRPKLADFGLSTAVQDGELRTDFVGSPQYCAPEILQRIPYDAKKADIWALGVTFYEMACGKIMWPEVTDRLVESIVVGGVPIKCNCPLHVARIVRSMTRASPAQRPTIDQVLALKDVQDAPRAAGRDGEGAGKVTVLLPEWGKTVRGPVAPGKRRLSLPGHAFMAKSSSLTFAEGTLEA
jgi:serine/threonine protein kinase